MERDYKFMETRETGRETKQWPSSTQFNSKGDNTPSNSNASLGDQEISIDARAASYILYVQERFRLQTSISWTT